MTLQEIKTLLLQVTPNTYHYEAYSQPDFYIVWAEDGVNDTVWADNALIEKATQGTIDYFTKTEYDPLVKVLESKLNEYEVSFRGPTVQKENEYIHYEYIFEIDGD